jgi:hypothetical protein
LEKGVHTNNPEQANEKPDILNRISKKRGGAERDDANLDIISKKEGPANQKRLKTSHNGSQ